MTMPDNLFSSWQKPTEGEPVKIGDTVRFKTRNGSMLMGVAELTGRVIEVRVLEYDHWAFDIGELVRAHTPSLEVYR